jgi:NAD(P)-dependent dehydrogenase (short-subunit alcohol dehydrogenase family)
MNIVVTGASRGIGYELVKEFARDGKNKIAAVSRTSHLLQKLQRESPEGSVLTFCCDLSDRGAVTSLVTDLSTHFGNIDILINNAGAIVNKPFLQLDRADLQKVYEVNVFSVIGLIQQLMPMLQKSRKAHVVNISSMGGFQGSAKFAGLSAYSSSKAALACLTECLAEEFKDSSISFNCLALGATQTEMLAEAFPGYHAPVTAAEMAKFIANFSQTAHYQINGKVLPVSKSTP